MTTLAIGGTPIANETVDPDYAAVPRWVVAHLADNKHKVKPVGMHSAAVWERLVRRLPLTGPTKNVAATLMEHWPMVRPSIDRVSDLSGSSRGTVNNSIALLAACGLVALERRPGAPTRYVPLWPYRPVTEDEVAAFMKDRRAVLHKEGGHHVATPAGVSSETPGHLVATYPATTCPPGGHDVADTWPPRGHEVSKEAINEDSDQDSGSGLAAARAALRQGRAEARAGAR